MAGYEIGISLCDADEEFTLLDDGLCECGSALCDQCKYRPSIRAYLGIITEVSAEGTTTVVYLDGDSGREADTFEWRATKNTPATWASAIVAMLSPQQIKELNQMYRCLGIRQYLTRSLYNPDILWVCPWTEADEAIAREKGLPIESVAKAIRCGLPLTELCVAPVSNEKGRELEICPDLAW